MTLCRDSFYEFMSGFFYESMPRFFNCEDPVVIGFVSRDKPAATSLT
ncbi:hypothetical protein PFLA_a2376 [Pseudoalteromonas flavipulchra NCIMB 2033 = ATCC BAA-314]|nr:hypothetical protein [Pseudoalteromonas flavipulchra NCIMB 2033 = ATCC BAA-314]